MKIKANDHDALNAAFAERVCGFYLAPNGCIHRSKESYDNDCFAGGKPLPDFTHSADAVIPYLGRVYGWSACEVLGHPDIESGVCVHIALSDDKPESTLGGPWNSFSENGATAPTFAHAAVIALLRANGVEIED